MYALCTYTTHTHIYICTSSTSSFFSSFGWSDLPVSKICWYIYRISKLPCNASQTIWLFQLPNNGSLHTICMYFFFSYSQPHVGAADAAAAATAVVSSNACKIAMNKPCRMNLWVLITRPAMHLGWISFPLSSKRLSLYIYSIFHIYTTTMAKNNNKYQANKQVSCLQSLIVCFFSLFLLLLLPLSFFYLAFWHSVCVCVFIHNNNTPDSKPKYLANGMGGDSSPTFQTTRAYIYMQEHMGKNIERERKKIPHCKKGVKQTRTHEMILYSELSG